MYIYIYIVYDSFSRHVHHRPCFIYVVIDPYMQDGLVPRHPQLFQSYIRQCLDYLYCLSARAHNGIVWIRSHRRRAEGPATIPQCSACRAAIDKFPLLHIYKSRPLSLGIQVVCMVTYAAAYLSITNRRHNGCCHSAITADATGMAHTSAATAPARHVYGCTACLPVC